MRHLTLLRIFSILTNVKVLNVEFVAVVRSGIEKLELFDALAEYWYVQMVRSNDVKIRYSNLYSVELNFPA